jgi:hypothetical protein
MIIPVILVLIGICLLFYAFKSFKKYKGFAGMNQICEATITELKYFGEDRMGAAVIPKASYTYNDMAYAGTHLITIPAYDLKIKEGTVLEVLIDPSRPEFFMLPSLNIDRYKSSSKSLALGSLLSGVVMLIIAVILFINR